MLLILLALLLFIITDSRTINYIAKKSLASYQLSYESMEGNLFEGLEIKNLSYNNKNLFSSALIHWNPLTLLDKKLTITQLNAEGIEPENIIAMLNALKRKESKEQGGLKVDVIVKNSHFEINPFVYEGSKFSSFMFETGEIALKKELTLNAKRLYLKFDSDIVNLKMRGEIAQNRLLIDRLDLKNISVEAITKLTSRVKANAKKHKVSSSKQKNTMPFFKEIKVRHIAGTMKPFSYEGLKIKNTTFSLNNLNVDKKLLLNVNPFSLKFDSEIVNLTMKGKIKNNQLLVERLDLKNIAPKAITKLAQRIQHNAAKKRQSHKRRSAIPVLKKIKIKHILGTIKPTQYGNLNIESATVNLYDAVIDPANHFRYDAKKLEVKGSTNFGKLSYQGAIKDSNISAEGVVVLERMLFEQYNLPLNFNTLKRLPNHLELNHEGVWIEINHQAQQVLKLNSDFNVDIHEATHQIHYDYANKRFTVESALHGSMSYAQNFTLNNSLHIDKNGLGYEGEVTLEQTKGLPDIISHYLLTSLSATYRGTDSTLNMNFDAPLLTGEVTMPNYRNAQITFKSRGANIALNRLIPNLPVALQNEQIALEGNGFIDVDNIEQSTIRLLAKSEIADVEVKTRLMQPYEILFATTIKDDTLLRELIPKVKFERLRYVTGSIKIENNHYLIEANNEYLSLFVNFNSLNGQIEESLLTLDNQPFSIERDSQGHLTFQTHITNIQAFLERVKPYYLLNVPNIQGEVDLKLEQQSDGRFWIHLKSPKLQYLSENSVELSVFNLYDIDTTFTIDSNSNIEIQNYQFRVDDNGYVNLFYSNKISSLQLQDERLIIKNLWVNDKIRVRGEYNLETLQGTLTLKSDGYALNNKDFALLLGLDLEIKLNQEKVDIEGDIDILDGTITYEIKGSGIVEDSDIVIIENMIKEKESAFNNLKLYLKIKNRKPIRYIAEDINIELINQLSLLKNYNQKMLLTGVTTILKGYYQLEDKQFFFDESHLYFTGDLKSPLLDIKANYEKDQYTVHIFISGTTDAPIVNFNSEPYLTQQEILSLILFDGTGSSSGKGAEAYTILGGTFAKGLIRSLGIPVDHLLLGQDQNQQLSLEVGGKVSKNISILYIRKDGLNGAKVRIEHSKSFETDIIIQPPNTSSIEFLYKQDR
jgi:translocation and assembly module TamB